MVDVWNDEVTDNVNVTMDDDRRKIEGIGKWVNLGDKRLKRRMQQWMTRYWSACVCCSAGMFLYSCAVELLYGILYADWTV